MAVRNFLTRERPPAMFMQQTDKLISLGVHALQASQAVSTAVPTGPSPAPAPAGSKIPRQGTQKYKDAIQSIQKRLSQGIQPTAHQQAIIQHYGLTFPTLQQGPLHIGATPSGLSPIKIQNWLPPQVPASPPRVPISPNTSTNSGAVHDPNDPFALFQAGFGLNSGHQGTPLFQSAQPPDQPGHTHRRRGSF